MYKSHSWEEVRLQCIYFKDKGCNVLMNKKSVLEQSFWANTCSFMCRAEFITGVHSRLGEFWNSCISELTINLSAPAYIFIVFTSSLV